MEANKACAAGATIERGTVAEVTESGYRVNNLDRPGLVSTKIARCDNGTYAVGDTVFFFVYRDGTGRILCKDSGLQTDSVTFASDEEINAIITNYGN